MPLSVSGSMPSSSACCPCLAHMPASSRMSPSVLTAGEQLKHSSVALPDILPGSADVVPRSLSGLPGPCVCTVLRRAAAVLAASCSSATAPSVHSRQGPLQVYARRAELSRAAGFRPCCRSHCYCIGFDTCVGDRIQLFVFACTLKEQQVLVVAAGCAVGHVTWRRATAAGCCMCVVRCSCAACWMSTVI